MGRPERTTISVLNKLWQRITDRCNKRGTNRGEVVCSAMDALDQVETLDALMRRARDHWGKQGLTQAVRAIDYLRTHSGMEPLDI